MSTLKRIFWLGSLLLFVGGCSGFRQVGEPRLGPEDPHHDIMGSLEIGDRVRLTLEDDVTISGEVKALTATSLALESESDLQDLQTIPVRDILVIEKGNRGSAAGQAVTVVLVAGLFAVIVAGLASSQADTDWGGFSGEG